MIQEPFTTPLCVTVFLRSTALHVVPDHVQEECLFEMKILSLCLRIL